MLVQGLLGLDLQILSISFSSKLLLYLIAYFLFRIVYFWYLVLAFPHKFYSQKENQYHHSMRLISFMKLLASKYRYFQDDLEDGNWKFSFWFNSVFSLKAVNDSVLCFFAFSVIFYWVPVKMCTWIFPCFIFLIFFIS